MASSKDGHRPSPMVSGRDDAVTRRRGQLRLHAGELAVGLDEPRDGRPAAGQPAAAMTARTAAVSSATTRSPPPPRLSSSRSAISDERAPERVDVAAADLGDEAVRRLRRHAQPLLHLRRGPAGLQPLGDGQGVAQLADELVEQAGGPLPLDAQLEQDADRALRGRRRRRRRRGPSSCARRSSRTRPRPPRRRGARRLRARARASPARAAGAAGGRRRARRAPARPAGRGRGRARAPRATTQPGRFHGLTVASSAICPPAVSTALTSAAGTLLRPSSRPKNATVSVSPSRCSSAAATVAASASFQRSTPSAMTKRRPRANVIADSAAITASGVQASPSSSSTPPAPLSASAIARSRGRRSAMRPWSSPWMR